MTAVVELGPVLVRAVTPEAGPDPVVGDPRLTDAALDGVDDPSVLVGDRVRPLPSVWSDLWDTMFADRVVGPVVLIVPSMWPQPRTDAVSEMWQDKADGIEVRRRSVAVARTVSGGARQHAIVVAEIGPQLVGVTRLRDGDEPLTTALGRDGPPDIVAQRVAAEILGVVGDATVVFDLARGVAGAPELAELIGKHLRGSGSAARCLVCDGDRVLTAASQPDPARGRPRRGAGPSWLAWPVAVVVVTVGVLVMQLGAGSRDSGQPVAVVIEGSVAVNVPALWSVDKVAAGSGSARLQINSPVVDGAALHITQSRVRDGDTMQHTADALRRLVAAEAPGVFVDFNPEDNRAGRAVVTYLEVRADHDIRWNVFVDGSIRISIGCQSARGRDSDIAAACDEAVRSAHYAR